MDAAPLLLTYNPFPNLVDVSDDILSCNSFDISPTNSLYFREAFGFQITWAVAEEDEYAACIFAPLLSVDEDAMVRTFNYTIENLDPAQEYTISVRPFRMEVSVLQGSAILTNPYLPVFGIRSSNVFVTTDDDAPVDGPQGLSFEAADETSISITWDEPTATNGEIKEYETELSGSEVILTEFTSQRVATFRSLVSSTTYSVRVRARTSDPEFGPWSNAINVTTCQSGTRTDSAKTECFAITGNVLTVEAVALSCTEFGESIDQAQCLGSRGLDVSELSLNPGYWRGSAQSALIRTCPIDNTCTGGNVSGSQLCTPGNTVSNI